MLDRHLMSRYNALFLLAVASLAAQDPKWLAKQPAFGQTKPLIRTDERWAAERGKIWIGVSFFYLDRAQVETKFCAVTPATAGTKRTFRGELTEGNNNQVVEYITKTDAVYWLPASGWHGISDTIVPTCESAKEIRLYDKDGVIIGDFTADPSAKPVHWDPYIEADGSLVFEKTSGGDEDFWEYDNTLITRARISGDDGKTWSDFSPVTKTHHTMPIPPELKDKEQLLVDVYSSRDMTIEVRRFFISNQPHARGVTIGH
jgi:hypothetical protein